MSSAAASFERGGKPEHQSEVTDAGICLDRDQSPASTDRVGKLGNIAGTDDIVLEADHREYGRRVCRMTGRESDRRKRAIGNRLRKHAAECFAA
jgi:hypothetical protein